MANVRDPILHPDRQNRFIELGVKHFEDGMKLVLGNLYPNGRMAGEEEMTDMVAKALYFMARHDENLNVALDPNALPGDQMRAQRELQEEVELRAKIFQDPEAKQRMEDALVEAGLV